jgi:hypothetical protein
VLNQLLNLMAPLQQLRAIKPQLLRPVVRGDALGDSPQNQHNLTARVPTAAPYTAGEEVEDRSTFSTAILNDRRPMAVVRVLFLRQRMSLGTLQPLWMQYLEQVLITPLLVHQLLNRKLQHASPVQALGWKWLTVYPILAFRQAFTFTPT